MKSDVGLSGAAQEVSCSYSGAAHVHRFAAWCAGRASSVKGARFPVSTFARALEQAGLDQISSPEMLPPPPTQIVGTKINALL